MPRQAKKQGNEPVLVCGSYPSFRQSHHPAVNTLIRYFLIVDAAATVWCRLKVNTGTACHLHAPSLRLLLLVLPGPSVRHIHYETRSSAGTLQKRTDVVRYAAG